MDWFLYDIGLRHERVNIGRLEQAGETKFNIDVSNEFLIHVTKL